MSRAPAIGRGPSLSVDSEGWPEQPWMTRPLDSSDAPAGCRPRQENRTIAVMPNAVSRAAGQPSESAAQSGEE